ncbi:Proc [Symbiodinium microadriaticum]|nr:Proc [Symbiodinium microadriaticum]
MLEDTVKMGRRFAVEVGGQMREVDLVIKHPQYDQTAPDDVDLALLRFRTPSALPLPLPLQQQQNELGQEVTLLGWGYFGLGTSGRQYDDGRFRRATNRITVANRYLRFEFDDPRDAASETLALEGVPGLGDSGGPALIATDTGMFLAGIAVGQIKDENFSEETQGEYGAVAIYERVSSHLDWIEEVVGAEAWFYKFQFCRQVKMVRNILVSIVLFVLILGGVGFYYFDSLVVRGIEVGGSRVLGTQVDVDSALISPVGGVGSISGLRVANLEGFQSDYAFQMEEISIELDVGSVFSDVVIVESVTISQPQITYERSLTRDNIRALLNNISSGGGASAPADEAASTRRIIIREFLMENPRVNLVAASMEAPIALPSISLRNIGEENNAATVADALRQILSAVSTSILNSDPPVLDMIRENVENRLQQGAEEVENVVDDAVEDLGNRLRGILN